MLGIEAKTARSAWTVFVVGLGIWLAWEARSTLVVFALALLFAYLLAPVVGLVHRYTPGRVSPAVSLAIVYLALVAVLVTAGVTIGSRIAEEASSLASRLPDLARNEQWQSRIPLPAWLEPQRARIVGYMRTEVSQSGRDVVPYLQRLGAQVVLGARYLGYAVLIPVLAFFFLKDGGRMREAILDQVGRGTRRETVEGILNDIDRLLGQYIRALVLQALSAFVLYAVFLGATGAPYAMLLAGIAGPLEFIPVVGPMAAGLITGLVTGLAGYGYVAWFVLFWVVLRGFQDYVLIPFLLGAGIEMDPLLVLFGVLAGEQVAGIAGMFFSVPVIAIARVVTVRLRRGRAGVGFAGGFEEGIGKR